MCAVQLVQPQVMRALLQPHVVSYGALERSTGGNQECDSYTCALARDLASSRTGCLDTGKGPGALSPSSPPGHETWVDGLSRAVPHILHFMSGLKPWMPGNANLRHTQAFYALWHRVNASSSARLQST